MCIRGATTLSIKTHLRHLALMPLSMITIFHYAECCVLFIVLLNVVMPNVIMLNVVMLNVVMLNVIKLNVVMLSVFAPYFRLIFT